jgi:hypothetical protein
MTGFNVVVPASSNQTKLYGNGMTAGQIALQAGLGGAMLFGPGNSQAHRVLCGSHVIGVHAVKAKAGACTTTLGVTAGVSPTTSTATTGGASAGTSVTGGTAVDKRSGDDVHQAKGHARATGVLGATTAGAVLGATARHGTLPFTGLALGLLLGRFVIKA